MQSLCSHISLTAAKTIVFIQHQICRFCCKTGDKDKAEIIRKKTQFCHHFLLHKKIIFRLQNPIFELVITKAFSLNKETVYLHIHCPFLFQEDLQVNVHGKKKWPTLFYCLIQPSVPLFSVFLSPFVIFRNHKKFMIASTEGTTIINKYPKVCRFATCSRQETFIINYQSGVGKHGE